VPDTFKQFLRNPYNGFISIHDFAVLLIKRKHAGSLRMAIQALSINAPRNDEFRRVVIPLSVRFSPLECVEGTSPTYEHN
jgi:hypothetical protein